MRAINIFKYFKERGIETINPSFYSQIKVWESWYKGDVAKFHYYRVYNGKSRVRCRRLSLGMAKKVSEDIADLLSSETSESINFYQHINQRFIELMDNDRMYLTPGLSVDAVAKEIGTNRAYISRLLNRTYNSTFPEFINGKRIKYAKQLLQDEPEAVLEYIALKSGFSTTSQFTRKFKEMTGQSPRQWQKSNKKNIRAL